MLFIGYIGGIYVEASQVVINDITCRSNNASSVFAKSSSIYLNAGNFYTSWAPNGGIAKVVCEYFRFTLEYQEAFIWKNATQR